MKFAPGGHSTFFAMLNAFVHIVMYFYYMIAAMGPKYQKYIWWKKYLTAFQMVSKKLQSSRRKLIAIFFPKTGSVRRDLYSPISAFVDSKLRVSQRIHGVDRSSRRHVPVPFLRFLQESIHRKAKKTE